MLAYAKSVYASEVAPFDTSKATTETSTTTIKTTNNTTTTTLIDEHAPVELKNNDTAPTETLQTETSTSTINKEPTITNVVVTGEYNDSAVGVDYYKNIHISLIGDNLTSHHFLTKEGLHWSDKTTVEIINSAVIGQVNGQRAFGKQNAPNSPITMYRNNIGDSGRITFVGQTQSGIDLDLIWEITDSNHDDWKTNAKYKNNTFAKGISFYGEQSIPGSTGNSIVVVYNNTSHIGINYKIVKHGTMDEQPVVLSFISTDIDAAQGVQTNLANIVELIPPKSNLIKDKHSIIYDTTPGVVGLNGSSDIPRGSYLGAGFLSQFDYVFYSPAPERMNKSYAYPFSVRYDMFGSSLQANLLMQVYQHIIVKYEDTLGKPLKISDYYKGFTDKSYTFDKLKIDGYRIVNIKRDISDMNYPSLTFIYAPVYPVTFQFVDEQGNKLPDDEHYNYIDKQHIDYTPSELDGYTIPTGFSQVINGKINHVFVYKKRVTGVEKVENIIRKPHIEKDENTLKEPTQSISYPIIENNVISKQTTKSNIVKVIKRQEPRIKRPVVSEKVQHNTQKTTPKAPNIISFTDPIFHDPFLENTGMNADEKQLFLNYIKEIGRQSRAKHGNNINKINHDIANAIAYKTYSNDKLQSIVNDFGKQPNVSNYEKVSEFLDLDSHGKPRVLIDFPHLAMPLATATDDTWYKKILRQIVGSNNEVIYNSSEDNFFQLNSMVGDNLTRMDKKDYITNQDAYILYYHPKFKNMPLDNRIEHYYHIDELDNKRDKLYDEALVAHSGNSLSADEQETRLNVGATLTLAATLLVVWFGGKRYKKVLTNEKDDGPNYVPPKKLKASGAIMVGEIVKNVSKIIANPISKVTRIVSNVAKQGVVAIKELRKPSSAMTTVSKVVKQGKQLFKKITKGIATSKAVNLLTRAITAVNKKFRQKTRNN